ncbi:HBL095Wp [Eremothecium sinecaudum]|uniref:HBL095Wp n=1 Tax=Eremothecium sinecaudum TaxID=45286 RepID=A0A109UWW1_9SACH|nr:HBL095Wp [Eremothecium sinecaudum]AMD18807.1 HBL095Wp [Eremothecium sinecaudum]
MSNQSGITANDDLLSRISNLHQDGKSIVAGINDTSTEVNFISQLSGVDEIKEYLTAHGSVPCYIMCRANGSLYFISFTPDLARVRDRTLYASTKNTILRQIGSNNVSSITMITDPDEFSEELWNQKKVPGPLSESEKVQEKVDEQLHSEAYVNSRQGRYLASMHGGVSSSLSFKFNSSEPFSDLLNSKSALTFEIDCASEQIVFSGAKNPKSPKELINAISTKHPSYTVYKSQKDSVFFIYSCPSGSKVKERMIYAANKKGFMLNLQDEHGLVFLKSIEVGDPEELELSTLSPDLKEETESDVSKPIFNRPKGPQRRARS